MPATDFRFHKPLTDDEVDALRQQLHPELMAVRADALLATVDQYQARILALEAEVSVLRGSGCCEDGDRPCGVCLKCARHPNTVLLRAAKAMIELLADHQAKDACTCTSTGWCPACGPHDVQEKLRLAIQDPMLAKYLQEKDDAKEPPGA